MTTRASGSTSPTDIDRFRHLVTRRLGLFFEESKLGFLGDVLLRRLDASGLDTESYLARLERSTEAAEIDALAAVLTVPETYFFRNIEQFRALAEVVVPDRCKAREPWRSLRLLSAGCASGEEAYSLAIVVRQSLKDGPWQLSVRGVDVNPTVLERARRGRYSTWALRETPEDQRRWFQQEGRDLLLNEAVLGAVQLERRNLTEEDPDLWTPGRYDIVFCRNVLMYFAPDHARAVVARISRSLGPGGFLFLGHAETLRGLSQDFHLRHTHGTFYYQRKDAALMVSPEREDLALGTSMPPPLVALVDQTTSWIEAIQQASERIHALAATPAPDPTGFRKERQRVELGAALDLLRSERFSEALAVVRALPSEAASDPDVLMLEAVLLTHSGQLERASEACEKLLLRDDLSAGAHYLLALCHETTGDRRKAVDHDQVSIYLDPTFAMPRLHLGLLARRDRDFATARRELRNALLLLQREDASRVLLFGGGFSRDALVVLSQKEIEACGASV